MSQKQKRTMNSLFAPTRLELGPYLSAIIEELKPFADKKGIQIDVKQAPDVDSIFADQGVLQEILFSLLSNAIKHNHDNGKVTILISKTDQYIQFQIEDTGPGVSEEVINEAFNCPITLTKGGLALAKRLVELHNGQILAQSREDSGLTVTFWIPENMPE